MARSLSLRNAVREVRRFRNWPTFMLDALGYRRPGPVTYRLRNGLEFEMRAASGDVSVLYETWVLDAYSPPEFRLPRDAVVLDVGAHVGTFALRAAHEAPQGRVYAFEPTAENFRLLAENVRANRASNVTAVNAAVSGKPGRATIALDRSNSAMHSLVAPSPGGPVEEVEVVRLDEFVEKEGLGTIDLLKLDCEGAEYEILLGAEARTLASVRHVALEWHAFPGAPGPETLERRLRDAGFHVRRAGGTPMLYAWR